MLLYGIDLLLLFLQREVLLADVGDLFLQAFYGCVCVAFRIAVCCSVIFRFPCREILLPRGQQVVFSVLVLHQYGGGDGS